MRGETTNGRVAASTISVMVVLLATGGCHRVAQIDDLGPDAGTDSDSDSDTDVDSDTDSDGDSDTDSDADSDTQSDTAEEECELATVDLWHEPSSVLLLLDRSRSMYLNTVETETYAEVVADAIKTVIEEAIATNMVSFGLSAFPSLECPPNEEETEFECAPADDMIVEAGPFNYAEIDLALDAIGTCGGTPMCESLNWAHDYLTGDDFPDELDDWPKYVLLATDGAPNCNADGDVESCTCTAETCMIPEQCLDDLCTYNAALSLAADGIPVFVIGVGDDVAEWAYVLDNIATYGGTSDHYPAEDEAAMEEAVGEITGATIGCNFGVPWSTVPDDVQQGCDRVAVDGLASGWEEIPHVPECDAYPAWRWVGEPPLYDDSVDYEEYCSVVELCPETCEAFKDALYTDIRARIGCPVEMD